MVNNGSEIYEGADIYNDGAAIYNGGADIYNNGSGGGGDNTIEIEGYTYKFVKIGSLYWITENLRVTAPNAVTYKEGALNEYGLYYQPAGDFSTIENKLFDGWRIATRNDWLNLYSECGNNNNDFINNCFDERYRNANNLNGLTLLSCGYRGSGGGWYNDTANAIYWTSTIKSGNSYYDLYTNFNSDGDIRIVGTFMNDSTSGNSEYRAAVRICKDVE